MDFFKKNKRKLAFAFSVVFFVVSASFFNFYFGLFLAFFFIFALIQWKIFRTLQALDFRVSRLYSYLKDLERKEEKYTLQNQDQLSDRIDQKILFKKLKLNFPKGILSQEKNGSYLLQDLKDCQASLESLIVKKERNEFEKIHGFFEGVQTVTSSAEWKLYLEDQSRTKEDYERSIKFLVHTELFRGESKKKLLQKAVQQYAKKENKIEKFLSTIDFVLKNYSYVLVAYYACQKIMESEAGYSYEKYLSLVCEKNEELSKPQRERVSFILAEIKMLQTDLTRQKNQTHYKSENQTLFYVLHNSEPYMTFGYASRTRGMMLSLQNAGYKVYGVTRLGFPTDRYNLKESLPEASKISLEDSIDGRTYLRLLPKDGKGLFEKPMDDYCEEAKEALIRLAYQKKPSLMIAASNFYTAFPAICAARELKIPFVYEVRGFWEITRLSRDTVWEGSYAHKFYEKMETKIALASDKVLTLTKSMKDLIEDRCQHKISVDLVPNAMTSPDEVFEKKDEILLHKFRFEADEKIIGFIGSVVSYEGLDLLVEAAKELSDLKIRYLIVGDGAYLETIKLLANKLGVFEKFIFVGRVPHCEVNRYYSLIDLVVLPRLSLPVTELVSPLKPFEAMAHKKLVLMSDVSAMKEFTKEGINGYLFEKENLESLIFQIKNILFSENKYESTKLQACEWVHKYRTWPKVTKALVRSIETLQVQDLHV